MKVLTGTSNVSFVSILTKFIRCDVWVYKPWKPAWRRDSCITIVAVLHKAGRAWNERKRNQLQMMIDSQLVNHCLYDAIILTLVRPLPQPCAGAPADCRDFAHDNISRSASFHLLLLWACHYIQACTIGYCTAVVVLKCLNAVLLNIPCLPPRE